MPKFEKPFRRPAPGQPATEADLKRIQERNREKFERKLGNTKDQRDSHDDHHAKSAGGKGKKSKKRK